MTSFAKVTRIEILKWFLPQIYISIERKNGYSEK